MFSASSMSHSNNTSDNNYEVPSFQQEVNDESPDEEVTLRLSPEHHENDEHLELSLELTDQDNVMQSDAEDAAEEMDAEECVEGITKYIYFKRK